MFQPSVKFNIDPALESYVEFLDIDIAEASRLATDVGIKRDLSVNLHAAAMIERARSEPVLMQGAYNIVERQSGDMPPADIDIFIGSAALEAKIRADGDILEAERLISQVTNDSLRHELIHTTDPNMPERQLTEDDPIYIYPGHEELKNHPSAKRHDQYEAKLRNTAQTILASGVGISVFAAGAVYEFSPYHPDIATAGALAIGGLGSVLATYKLIINDFKKMNRLGMRAALDLRDLDQAELFVERRLLDVKESKVINITLGSMAIRKIPIIRTSHSDVYNR